MTIPGTLDDIVTIRQWKTGYEFPKLSKLVAVDTETELITDSVLFPPLVVTGVYDPDSLTSWLISYEDSNAFMAELCRRDITQVYFNLGFDQGVLNKNDPKVQPLLRAIDAGRVRDMQMRVHLYEIATKGYIDGASYSLKGCCKKYLHYELDKGDGTTASARLSFKRDIPLTQEQIRYLPLDCITTWAISQKIAPQATEVIATKGMCVLADITANGVFVDKKVHEKYVSMLVADKEKYAAELRAFGYPVDKERTSKDYVKELHEEMCRFCGRPYADSEAESHSPKVGVLRRLLVHMYNHDKEPGEADMLEYAVGALWFGEASDKLSYSEAGLYRQMVDDLCLELFATTKKKSPLIRLVLETVRALFNQRENARTTGYDVAQAIADSAAVISDSGDFDTDAKKVGPRKFFLDYVVNLLKEQFPGGKEAAEKHMKTWESSMPKGADLQAGYIRELVSKSKLKLDLTKKACSPKLTKNDVWRLEDLGICDKFLTAYTNYNHCVKYMSTYMKESYIKSDGKLHPKYTNLVRTSRTSATAPNIQNFPSRDPVYKLKLMCRADPGYIMCATDFSFIELCAFGQACYTRFRNEPYLKDVEGSVMRLIINAGLDPHRWFAGVMTGKISPDLSRRNDKDWVASLSEFLESQVTKAERQTAKFANFGLPGGLSEASYYKHCREGGLNCTYSESKLARDAWLDTFKEMHLHTTRLTPMPTPKVAQFQYGLGDIGFNTYLDEDGEEVIDTYDAEFQPERKKYLATTITGMVRADASANSAMNIQFQGIVAQGAKLAGWNLVKAGYGNRLKAFIHDEYLYQLKPEELDTHIPRVEQLMLRGMREIIPDVKIGVETSCCIHWDKGAKEYAKLPRDEAGRVIVSDTAAEEVLAK